MITDPQRLSTVQAGTRIFIGTTRPINGIAAMAPNPVPPRNEKPNAVTPQIKAIWPCESESISSS